MKPARSSKARAPLSLKGRALALLAQRDQSRVELGRKLLRHALAEAALTEQPAGPDANDGTDRETRLCAAAHVEALLDWLEAHRYLSEQRFTESRVHARAPRFGNLRIRMELAQHRLQLSPQAEQELVETELERARAMRERKFGAAPADATERARQARFLTARGFTADAVRRALRADDDDES